MEYKVISGDAHIDLRWLPADLFSSSVPAKWKDLAPQLVETEEGKAWFVDGKNLTAINPRGMAGTKPPAPGTSNRLDRMIEAGFYEGGPHPTTPELRILDQEIDGVDAEVIYGVLLVGKEIKDSGLRSAVYQIYNTWVADFCKANPTRLVALACIPNDDPQVAADELRRVSSLGLRGADFDVGSAVIPIWHRDWDSLWAAAEECEIPISFHTTGCPVRRPSDPQMAKDYDSQHRATHITMFQIIGGEYLSAIVFSGALERHPGFKFVLGECGVSWIPYVLTRMDDEYEDQFRHLGLTMMPSDYWRRQGCTTFQHEPLVADMVPFVGEDNILWGSDYPHPDGIWPDSHQFIQADLGRLSDGTVQKITCENTGKLYGLIK